MEVLFATKNPAKIKYYAEELKKEKIQVCTLSDQHVDCKVEETGKNAIENAKIKAKAYYEQTKMKTIAIDDTLYLEGVSKEDQPGAKVRRIKGKELTASAPSRRGGGFFLEQGRIGNAGTTALLQRQKNRKNS